MGSTVSSSARRDASPAARAADGRASTRTRYGGAPVQPPSPRMPLPPGFEPIDLVAVGLFLAAWTVHALVVSRLPVRRRTLSHAMHAYRFRWMENAVRRDSKMVDALIQNSLQQGVLFFASTSILVIGALLAGLGAAEQAVLVLKDLPFTSTDTRPEWDIKVLLVVGIVTYAFFKFAWSYRLFNYLIILIGAGPDPSTIDGEPDADEHRAWSTRLGKLHSVAAYHFTAGIHAYFHALSAMAWLLSPWLFIAATCWVSLVLYRRAFGSRFLRILTDRDDGDGVPEARTGA